MNQNVKICETSVSIINLFLFHRTEKTISNIFIFQIFILTKKLVAMLGDTVESLLKFLVPIDECVAFLLDLGQLSLNADGS